MKLISVVKGSFFIGAGNSTLSIIEYLINHQCDLPLFLATWKFENRNRLGGESGESVKKKGSKRLEYIAFPSLMN